MIKFREIKFAAAILVLAFAFWPYSGQDGNSTSLFIGAANAQSVSCTAETLANALGTRGGKLSKRDEAKFLRWCRTSVQDERKAQAASTTASTSLASPDGGGLGIICGANNCVCWKGKHWNGCNDITICNGPLTCTGPICTCTPH
jgi:hypothetical protein